MTARLLPDEPFPPYSYVTGRCAHPTRDPAGHSFGHAPPAVRAVDPARWIESREYLRGIDLWNHGYYWEAHEIWESLWIAVGRRGTVADFLKGLIKLAAAGVKAREGRTDGVRRHAWRANELFAQTSTRLPAGQTRFMGLELGVLMAAAERIAAAPPEQPRGGLPVEIVFDFVLLPAQPK